MQWHVTYLLAYGLRGFWAPRLHVSWSRYQLYVRSDATCSLWPSGARDPKATVQMMPAPRANNLLPSLGRLLNSNLLKPALHLSLTYFQTYSRISHPRFPLSRRMESTRAVRSATNPYRVFIAGGCYAGLSAAIHLLERCDSNPESPVSVAITIVDERDGYCTSYQTTTLSLHGQTNTPQTTLLAPPWPFRTRSTLRRRGSTTSM
jgi:hypothetical protein